MRNAPGAATWTALDPAIMDEALEVAAERFGRLSDEKVRAMRRRRRTIASVPAASAILAFLFFALQPSGVVPPAPAGRLFATRPGELGTARLADGSTVRLNGATRMRVTFSTRERSVEMLAGQAFFDVKHEPARPFVVRAGEGEARVLGTAFDIDLSRHRLALAVYRGAVGFGTTGAEKGVVVRAGYRSRMHGTTVEAPVGFDPTLPDWRQGWIDTDGMRLDDLVDVLGRQRSVAIARPTGALSGIRVAGRFRTDRPGDLLRAIGDGFGFSVRESDGTLILERD